MSGGTGYAQHPLFRSPLWPCLPHLLSRDRLDSAPETEVLRDSYRLPSPTIPSGLPSAQMPPTLVSKSQVRAAPEGKKTADLSQGSTADWVAADTFWDLVSCLRMTSITPSDSQGLRGSHRKDGKCYENMKSRFTCKESGVVMWL